MKGHCIMSLEGVIGILRLTFFTVNCVQDPSKFYADKLHKALQDGDTNAVAKILLGKNKVSQVFRKYRRQEGIIVDFEKPLVELV